jgi:site-specific DNA recombinase
LLADTLDLSRDCHAAYLEANGPMKRLFNQAFFTKIYIDEDGETREQTIRVDYNQPFDIRLSRLAPAQVHHDLSQKRTAHRGIPVGGLQARNVDSVDDVQGSHTDTLVEVMGLEPTTSTLRT